MVHPVRQTLPLDDMPALDAHFDPDDMLATQLYDRRRWQQLHVQARRIAQVRQSREGVHFPLPPLPRAYSEPPPSGVRRRLDGAWIIAGARWPKRWVTITGVILALDALVVVLFKSGIL